MLTSQCHTFQVYSQRSQFTLTVFESGRSVSKLKAFRTESGHAILKFHTNPTLNNVLFKIVCVLLAIGSRHPRINSFPQQAFRVRRVARELVEFRTRLVKERINLLVGSTAFWDSEIDWDPQQCVYPDNTATLGGGFFLV